MTAFVLSVRVKRPVKSELIMKQNQHTGESNEMRDEYDFASMTGGVRGKYAGAFENTAVTVLLDSDVAKVFPNSQAVNEALRTLARVLHDAEQNAPQGAQLGRSQARAG